MPVTQNKYLVGRIVRQIIYSRVLLLNDLNSRIPVTFDEKVPTILTGGGKQPTLSYLPEDYQFVEDITVFASEKDGIFNVGTPIGKQRQWRSRVICRS